MPPAARRPRQVVDDEEEEEERPRQRQRRDEPESDADEEEDEDNNEQVESADGQLVKKLVRYALACDFNRVAIRRDGIKEKVLGDQGRAFRRVFEGAQQTLQTIFGMQMVELPVRDKLTKEEKRKAAKSQSKATSSNAYVLASVLPDAYRTSRIITPSRILSDEDEAAYVAFYTMIISLIRLNGGELSDPKLKRYLRRLNAETNSYKSTKTEDTLAKLQRQGYLVKNIDKDARQHGDEQEATTWLVGPRGKVEVSDQAIAGLVRAVWGEESDELESRLQNSLHVQERKPAVQVGADGGVGGDDPSFNDANGEGPSRRRSGRRRPAKEEEEHD